MRNDGNRPFVSPTLKNFAARRRRRDQSISDAITRFSGSMTFVIIHVVWFGGWILTNLLTRDPFDPFPFGLLTLIVSLEAIFLSTFLLISQNKQSAASDDRAEQDFETNLYAEALSELIGEKVGIDQAAVQESYRRKLAAARRSIAAADDGRTG